MRGFSLIELLVATAIFVVVAGSAFSLFNRHVALAAKQETLSGVNIGMRNAMSQLEMDLSGAAQNLLGSVPNTPTFSLGVIIQNNVPGSAGITGCIANTQSWAYPTSSACFDSLTVIVPKSNAPVLSITDSEDLKSTTTINATDPNLVLPDATLTADLTRDAGSFAAGDELLILEPGGGLNCSPNTAFSTYCMTAVTLTANAAVAGSAITLPHNLVGAGGAPLNCPGPTCTDPLGIIFSATHNPNFTNALTATPSVNNTYIIDLGNGANNITYAVQANPANAADTQLVRCTGAACAPGNSQVLADEVVGFKVGAALWDYRWLTDIASYFYDSSKYCNGQDTTVDCTANPAPTNDPYDYSLVRSVRMSLIARTAPHADLSLNRFTNGFDGGPYMVQQSSVVVDLRNMNSF